MTKKPLFTNVLQIGLVVENLEKSLKVYADEYGIGPWNIYEFNPDTVKEMKIRDQRVDYAMKLALCNIGGVQWELIEPKDDKSVYAEYLKQHGPGLHHVAFGVEDYQQAVEAMKAKGHGILQEGVWYGFTYTYINSSELNVVSEFYNVPPGWDWPPPDAVYPEQK